MSFYPYSNAKSSVHPFYVTHVASVLALISHTTVVNIISVMRPLSIMSLFLSLLKHQLISTALLHHSRLLRVLISSYHLPYTSYQHHHHHHLSHPFSINYVSFYTFLPTPIIHPFIKLSRTPFRYHFPHTLLPHDPPFYINYVLFSSFANTNSSHCPLPPPSPPRAHLPYLLIFTWKRVSLFLRVFHLC